MIAPAAQYRAVQRSASVEVVERHADLVRRIAHHLAARLPASVEVDDLVQAGMLGLIEAAEVTRQIEQTTGRAATGAEIAQALGLAPEEYARLLEDAVSGQVLSLDSHIDDHGEPNVAAGAAYSPERRLQATEFRQALGAAIGQLPEREQLVLSLYYEQEMNLREVGAVLGVSESRVCQIHGQAMLRLRSRLGEFGSADNDTEDVG
jgi:RNA polymerase sigma factor for flagellar operon FliA